MNTGNLNNIAAGNNLASSNQESSAKSFKKRSSSKTQNKQTNKSLKQQTHVKNSKRSISNLYKSPEGLKKLKERIREVYNLKKHLNEVKTIKTKSFFGYNNLIDYEVEDRPSKENNPITPSKLRGKKNHHMHTESTFTNVQHLQSDKKYNFNTLQNCSDEEDRSEKSNDEDFFSKSFSLKTEERIEDLDTPRDFNLDSLNPLEIHMENSV